MLLGIRAYADSPDHFTIHDDRESALHFDETTRGRGCDATIVDRILEILARLLNKAAVRALPGASSTPASRAA